MTGWLLLIAFLALTAPTAARAQVPATAEPCVSEPSRIVELELRGCRPAEIALEEQMAGNRVWWLRPYVLSIARANPGVVVRGEIRRSRVFAHPETLGPWSDDGGGEELFYPSLDGALCEAFAGVDEALFVAEPPCCELIPPVSVACLLQTLELKPVPPRLIDVMDRLDEPAEAGDED